MSEISAALSTLPTINVGAGEFLLKQDEKVNYIYILEKGRVKVSRNGTDVAIAAEPGAVFGEMSIILDMPHSASVQCEIESSFRVIENPRQSLAAHPELLWHIARILCMRLFNLNQYLVDIKGQFAGHDHLGMVDDVLETLMNQQRTRILRREDSKRDTPGY